MSEILIVDDERTIRDGLRTILSGEGYSVRLARDGDEALKKIAERKPDLVLLDVMMPRLGGFPTCEAIRKTDNLLPVIFLTAKDSEADQVRGIGLGADDYIPKACGDAVMLACIRRALSRSKSITEAVGATSGGPIRIGKVTVDPKSYAVLAGKEEIARLTKTEMDLLEILDSSRGTYFKAEELIERLRGQGFTCAESMLYTHVTNLRHKLGPAGGMLASTRFAGYRLLK